MKDSVRTGGKSKRLVRFGDRVVLTRGLRSGLWSDLYHHSLTVSWTRFFAFAALAFFTLNIAFASLYALGTEPIANARPGVFRDLLYFSIETLATVGYGDMHPQSDYAHLLATTEIFTGISFISILTGLVFARFSRPRARLLFAHNPLISTHEGQRVWTVRVANVRLNAITEATARLWLIKTTETAEGGMFRSFNELPLLRSESPAFALSWTLFHIIDETSPLFGLDEADLERMDVAFVVTVKGHDESLAQQISARKTYPLSDIRWDHRYEDILSVDHAGKTTIDYAGFHRSFAADRPIES